MHLEFIDSHRVMTFAAHKGVHPVVPVEDLNENLSAKMGLLADTTESTGRGSKRVGAKRSVRVT